METTDRVLSLVASVIGLPKEELEVQEFMTAKLRITSKADELFQLVVFINHKEGEIEYATRLLRKLQIRRDSIFEVIRPDSDLILVMLGKLKPGSTGLVEWMRVKRRTGGVLRLREDVGGGDEGQVLGCGKSVSFPEKLEQLPNDDLRRMLLPLAKSDLEEAMAVILEQGDYDPLDMCLAIQEHCGGWKCFLEHKTVITTDTGIVIVPTNKHTADLVRSRHMNPRGGGGGGAGDAVSSECKSSGEALDSIKPVISKMTPEERNSLRFYLNTFSDPTIGGLGIGGGGAGKVAYDLRWVVRSPHFGGAGNRDQPNACTGISAAGGFGGAGNRDQPNACTGISAAGGFGGAGSPEQPNANADEKAEKRWTNEKCL
jgi:hypothetical protein